VLKGNVGIIEFVGLAHVAAGFLPMVMPHMGSLVGAEFEVVGVVIEAVFVFVMNYLTIFEGTAKLLLHDPTVQINLLAVDADRHVAGLTSLFEHPEARIVGVPDIAELLIFMASEKAAARFPLAPPSR
jgi:hypothetical protein